MLIKATTIIPLLFTKYRFKIFSQFLKNEEQQAFISISPTAF
jgi:hypothetical protein